MARRGSPETNRSEHCSVISAVFGRSRKWPEMGGCQTLPRLLLKVTIQGTLGPVHVVMAMENTVLDVIKAVTQAYAKAGRRPPLPGTDPRRFELHYSEFNFESLNPNERLVNLGSRNFFLCPRRDGSAGGTCTADVTKMASGSRLWLFFMDCLL